MSFVSLFSCGPDSHFRSDGSRPLRCVASARVGFYPCVERPNNRDGFQPIANIDLAADSQVQPCAGPRIDVELDNRLPVGGDFLACLMVQNQCPDARNRPDSAEGHPNPAFHYSPPSRAHQTMTFAALQSPSPRLEA